MNEINDMNSSLINSPLISSESYYFSSNIINQNLQTLSLFQFNSSWILPLLILSLIGIILTMIILFYFLYLSIYRLNDHLILPNFFLCFSIGFIYIILIIFLIRPNEFLCGLREFLSQLAYVLLYSSLLLRYIMQWLSTRILSKRTKQLTSLLIYFLLIFIQIPIGILWWYFTIPHFCQYYLINEKPKFKFHFSKKIFIKNSCSYQCIIDYRFYATYTYIIIELFLCTIISLCLYFYRCSYRNKNEKIHQKNSSDLLIFLNMLGLILIDLTWLIWTFIYYYIETFFIFPSIMIEMFIINTICFSFILIPQIYFYSKNSMNHINIPKTTLYSNRLASIEDIQDQDLLVQEKSKKNQTLSNGSELSYELGTSGTFLPITKTPKGLFKITNIEKTISTEKSDDKSTKNETTINVPITNPIKQQSQSPTIAPLQRQLTSSSLASDFVNSNLKTEHLQRSHSNIHPSSNSLYYSSYIPPYRDETLIPILCTSQQHQKSTPVKMRILVKSSSSSVPTTRRIYSGNDHRYIQQYPYHHFPHLPPPPSPATPLYYSPSTQQHYYHHHRRYVDPYRTIPSFLPVSHRYPYSYRRFPTDNRTLSQRLWDIDSGDDQDEFEDNIYNTQDYRKDFRSKHIKNNNHTLLHINDHEQEISDNQKLVLYNFL